MQTYTLNVHAVAHRARAIAQTLTARFGAERRLRLYGVPRGGIPAAFAVASYLPNAQVEAELRAADVVIDDIIDSGATRHAYSSRPFYALVNKQDDESDASLPWVVFPWEGPPETAGEDVIVRLLELIGEDPTREGLRETPKRVLKAWREGWAAGYDKDPAGVLKTFEDGAEGVDQMVLVRDIPVYSMCEHHLAPFFGLANVAYIPNGRVVGLSKLSRVVDMFARRLQVQERLTEQVATAIDEALRPQGVAVSVRCRHLCMESRGVSQHGHSTVTTSLRGAFRDDAQARMEFLHLCNTGERHI